jgi:hypothetical protein
VETEEVRGCEVKCRVSTHTLMQQLWEFVDCCMFVWVCACIFAVACARRMYVSHACLSHAWQEGCDRGTACRHMLAHQHSSCKDGQTLRLVPKASVWHVCLWVPPPQADLAENKAKKVHPELRKFQLEKQAR